MKIRQMRQIMEVGASESINRAAQRLYISQSALSASIQSAEEELGQKLMVRSHNGVILTDFGKKFVEASKQILAIYDKLLLETTQDNAARLAVSCQYLRYARTVFLRCCAEFADSRNDFRYAEKTRGEVCRDVMNGVSDIGIILPPTDCREDVFRILEEKGLAYHLITVDKIQCMVGPKNPLYHQESDKIFCHQLAEFKRVHYEREESFWGSDIYKDEIERFPCQGSISISDSGSFQNIMSETDRYFLGVHNEHAYKKNDFYTNIRLLEIADSDSCYDTIWVCRKNWHPTPFARKFLREVYLAAGQSENDLTI